jgi:uncharacterized membrane protein
MTTLAHLHGKRRGEPPSSTGNPEHVQDTVASVVDMEVRERAPSTAGAWLAELITAFSGSLPFVVLNAAFFAGWIVWNTGVFGLPVFDSFPYVFLTFAVSLEAIFLSTFVLISQNRQSARADRRSLIDLQVNVIAERELTKILKIVADIHNHIGAESKHDPEIEAMLESIRVEDLERVTSEAEQAAGADAGAPSRP